MAPKQKTPRQSPAFQPDATAAADDSQDAGGPPPPFTTQTPTMINCSRNDSTIPKLRKLSRSSGRESQLLKPSNSAILRRPAKRSRTFISVAGKENIGFACPFPSKMGIPLTVPPLSSSSFNSASPHHQFLALTSNIPADCGLDSISSTIDCGLDSIESTIDCGYKDSTTAAEEIGFELNPRGGSYSSNSLEESKLLTSTDNPDPYYPVSMDEDNKSEEVEHCTQLDVLLRLCSEVNEQDGNFNGSDFDHQKECHFNDSLIPIHCPLCGTDISDLTDELRQVHTNVCLDKEEETLHVVCPNDDVQPQCPRQVVDGSPIKSTRKIVDVSPVLEWLRSLGLAKYEQVFVREEIDWDALQWLTEEDLVSIGVTALGPRKKIVHALGGLRKESTKTAGIRTNDSIDAVGETSRPAVNKLITDFFPGPVGNRKKVGTCPSRQCEVEKCHSDVQHKPIVKRKNVMNERLKDIPQWCCIPGTPFRVDAFKYLRRDCSHWFLTHFHVDHYQGLVRSFSHGKIYCSLITAKLVNLKIGIPWDKLQVLQLNQKVNVAGVDVTCFDANHCPGSIMILFEPPNGKAVLHTGDFRFCEEMTEIPALKMCSVQTLILDTTYCNPQYDFPKQEAVFQFVTEAIQAEAFNPKTLFLIGSYTIGKERLFLEVARALCKKLYVTAAKLRLLECLGLSTEDMQWFTSNELESNIHVVPMWTLASFKRLKSVSNQYMHRFSLIVAFSPTGWTFSKGKKKSSGRRWQQGTIVRYEIPYSEHCSFTELKEFVKFVSPESIIPSVNNDGPESASAIISLLSS